MEPSTIFAIIAGAIIIFGRIINRAAKRSTTNTDQDFDTRHEFDNETSIPKRHNGSEVDTLAGSILAQILAEKHHTEIDEEEPQSIYTQRIPPPKFASNASVAPKPKKSNKTKKKIQPSAPIQESGTTTNNAPTPELLDDFDLRKAVIFSEILKPKFDE